MTASSLLRNVRQETGLSVRQFADAAGVSFSSVHRIEKGTMHPTVDMLQRLLATAGVAMRIEAAPDARAAVAGLAKVIAGDLASADDSLVVRRVAEFVTRFNSSEVELASRMVAVEPTKTGSQRWDAFLAGLVEWITVVRRMETPAWAYQPSRYLAASWWVTPLHSLRAWEYAGTPASFQNRGVYIHRDSLVNV